MPSFTPSRREFLGAAFASALPGMALAEPPVDLALALAIDCSLSVDDYDYKLQLRGTGQALIDSTLLQLIEQGENHVIAVSAFLWSSPKAQQVIVPWRIVRTGAEANAVADAVLTAPRTILAGSTATGNALAFAEKLLLSAPVAARRVIDVSTNGHSNMGIEVKPVRDRLVSAGVVINGLAVTDGHPDLAAYMKSSVAGGAGSFVIEADNFNAYTRAIRLKLFREIAGARPA
ncbi:DUF1194 domain-containing protein [Aestuariivirga litoralis]|uniref:DUF1194 domain-containing protein n=1 Tax=Aestuariivirga litoralis TaxID=2650924 RepID=UPI0018C4BAD8|nr:DUF1194 domain-containing protein [Aestuariivirga litoralis]MBG1232273.1 DUF1194 domain-containing protein [Aestuariivirga litoralis]